jgi:hypothetical protein
VREEKAWAGICRIKSPRLAEWLRSNPVDCPFKTTAPMIRLDHDDGLLRWPLVPDSPRDVSTTALVE